MSLGAGGVPAECCCTSWRVECRWQSRNTGVGQWSWAPWGRRRCAGGGGTAHLRAITPDQILNFPWYSRHRAGGCQFNRGEDVQACPGAGLERTSQWSVQSGLTFSSPLARSGGLQGAQSVSERDPTTSGAERIRRIMRIPPAPINGSTDLATDSDSPTPTSAVVRACGRWRPNGSQCIPVVLRAPAWCRRWGGAPRHCAADPTWCPLRLAGERDAPEGFLARRPGPLAQPDRRHFAASATLRGMDDT